MSLAVHPDGITVATGEDGVDAPKIIIWRSQFVGRQCPETQAILRGAHTHPISFLNFSPNGQLLLSVALDAMHTVKVHDWATGHVVFSSATDHRQVCLFVRSSIRPFVHSSTRPIPSILAPSWPRASGVTRVRMRVWCVATNVSQHDTHDY